MATIEETAVPMSDGEQSQSAIREEKRPRGGKIPLICKVCLFPILFFVLMMATNCIALGVFGLVHTNDGSLFLAGAVGFGMFGIFGYALLLGYRSFDRRCKHQLKHEYRGAFGTRIRPSEEAVCFFNLLGLVIAVVTGVLGAHAQGLMSPPMTAPLLLVGATAFAFGFDRMRQRAEIRRRKKKWRRREKAAMLPLVTESQEEPQFESLRQQEAVVQEVVEPEVDRESTILADAPASNSQGSQAALAGPRSAHTVASASHLEGLMMELRRTKRIGVLLLVVVVLMLVLVVILLIKGSRDTTVEGWITDSHGGFHVDEELLAEEANPPSEEIDEKPKASDRQAPEVGSQELDEAFLDAYIEIIEKYPEIRDDNSQLYRGLVERLKRIEVTEPARLAKPRELLMELADETAEVIDAVTPDETINTAVTEAPLIRWKELDMHPQPSVAPSSREAPPTPPESVKEPEAGYEIEEDSPAPVDPADEIQAYLEAAQRGEAGVDPALQTRARSGDPDAIRAVERRLHSNRLQQQVREGTISQAEANRRKDAFAQQQESQRIADDLEYQIEVLERLEHEVRRQQWERESGQYRRR